MRSRGMLFSFVTVVVLLAATAGVHAMPADPTDPSKKMDGNLATIAAVSARDGDRAAQDEARRRGMRVEEGRIRTVVTSAGDVAATKADVEEHGGRVPSVLGREMSALVPSGSLRALAADHDVATIALPLARRPAEVDGEGVAFVNAPAWHANGFTGAGVKIAILDLGFQGLATAQAAGDLPAIPDAQKGKFCAGGIDGDTEHGTAVAEIVHEMAPDATLYLVCIGPDSDDLNQSVQFAIDKDVDVVNHSVSWYNSSRGDGSGGTFSPDWEAKRARDAGILWVNAAGNEGQTHYHSVFPTQSGAYFNFSGGDSYNETASPVQSGRDVCAFLKWDRWSTPTIQNYDLHLYRLQAGQYTEVSPGDHSSFGPTEVVCDTNNGADAKYAVRIFQHATEFPPKRFDLFLPGFPLQYHTGSSLTEPAGSPSVLAAGAVCWSNGQIEAYSSTGPSIAGVIKPELTAPDSVSGTTYGAYTNCGPAATGFPGTSAASPHVAGAAALVKEQNPSFTAGQLQSWLSLRARDQGPGGLDNQYGWGRVWFRSFTDVPPTDYGYSSVELLRENSITGGCSSDPVNTRYCPTADVSRAEMAIFIDKSAGIAPCTNCTTPTFADVSPSHFAYQWIEALYKAGVTAGCGSSGGKKYYCPSNRVTRAQMAIFLMKAAHKTACTNCAPPTFSDVPASYWAYGYIERLYAEGVTAGCGGTKYCPENNVTRRDMAIFLVRTFDLVDPTPP